MYKVGIIGGTGYTGGELARLLCTHPDVEITSMTSRQSSGESVSSVHSFLNGYTNLCFTKTVDYDVDLAFIATPHGAAMKEIPQLMERGIKCIDLSGDYRMHDVQTYRKWYGHDHTDIDNLRKAVYGLPELFRNNIRGANLVANPGCYATAVILVCAPLMKADVVEMDIDIDAKSGTSGAGITPSARTHHAFCGESIIPYEIGTHRHTPEIEMVLKAFSHNDPKITFVPHLLPIIRGILSTCYMRLKKNLTKEDIQSIYEDQYGKEKFIHITNEASIRAVVGSNHVQISFRIIDKKIVAFGVIDNLVKGASGQAIQNMNLMLGLNESSGLDLPGLGV
ncbi:MAG: N-acetyl-gamma-glutamyl-phosphate reductase [archaeon]|nr:N-acetyl-gamma-glutamyl-phosphate reductase [archaeon]